MLSCAKVNEVASDEMILGSWELVEFFVNDELEWTNGVSTSLSIGSSTTYLPGNSIINRLTFERNKDFIIVDENEIVTTGTWSVADNNLILTDEAGVDVFNFSIIFHTFEKIHLLQEIDNPTTGPLSLRYLLNSSGLDVSY